MSEITDSVVPAGTMCYYRHQAGTPLPKGWVEAHEQLQFRIAPPFPYQTDDLEVFDPNLGSYRDIILVKL